MSRKLRINFPFLPPLRDYQVVTMLGKWPLTHPWVQPCIHSWHHLAHRSPTLSVVSDGSLAETDLQTCGLSASCHFNPDAEAIVARELESFPNLMRMRQRDLTWRKLLDVPLLHRQCRKVLLIDTDVLIRRGVCLPDVPGPVYLREDIPAYQARPHLPWLHPLVKSFNAGFVLFEPSLIDFEFLDHLAMNFFLPLKNPWWSEQAAWSALAGRSASRRFWRGCDACTLSGFRTRTPREIATNVVKLFSSKQQASREELRQHAGGAAVLHLAGLGKRNWDVFEPADTAAAASDEPDTLGTEPDCTVGLAWSTALSLRLLVKSLQ